jgi:hypothetical protein
VRFLGLKDAKEWLGTEEDRTMVVDNQVAEQDY